MYDVLDYMPLCQLYVLVCSQFVIVVYMIVRIMIVPLYLSLCSCLDYISLCLSVFDYVSMFVVRLYVPCLYVSIVVYCMSVVYIFVCL